MYKYIIVVLIFSIISWNVRAQTCHELTISNLTYSSDIRIGDCTITLGNVTVQNNSNLIVNSEMGITINGEFNVNIGSSLLTLGCQTTVPTLDPTYTISFLSCNSATSGGNVTSDGGATVTERGICWSTTQNPTITDSKVISGPGTSTFTATLSPLVVGTNYYVRSYATNSAGTGYGDVVTYTNNINPAIGALNVSNTTCNSATVAGNVTSDGCGSLSSAGICWSTTTNPTTANLNTSISPSIGNFSVNLTALSASILYYVRSYAINSAGTAYGTQISFTTLATVVPTLAPTSVVTGITCISATSGGNVTSDGCGTVTARGICWATTQNPTTSNSIFANGSGIGTFTGNLTGLSASTTYYVRSYAINSAVTAYGAQTSFTTLTPVIPTLAATSTVTGLSCTSASSGGNVTSDGGATVTERGICWSTSPNPTIANSKIASGSGTGSFSATLSPIVAGITYYVCSYATNSAGTGYGAQVSYTGPITIPVLAATATAGSITTNSASSGGNVTSDGCGTVTERGICWATTQNPTTVNSKYISGTGTGSYTGNLTGLSASTTYYVRSYAINSAGTAYGIQTSFTTLTPLIPTLAATSTVTGLSCTSASSGGNVTSDGGATVTERGICWSTSQNPTIANSKIASGSGTGSFSATLSPIVSGTTYYVCSYATNSAGTGYGAQVSYTGPITIPVLATTTTAGSITTNSASSGGNVTSDGCGTVTARGICWATTQNPTTSNSIFANGSGIGTYSGNLTGLSASTTYYVRSYAINSAGTAYGAQISFTTSPPTIVIPTLATTTAATSITQTSATSGGNITSDGGATVTERGICWSISSITPTITDSKATSGSGTGSFSAGLTGLTVGTNYNVRSYATNSAGTAYGAYISFTTSPPTAPVMSSTTTATGIDYTYATSGGVISSDGGASITAKGVCWSTSQNPTIANSKTIDGTGTSNFNSSITGLNYSTTYWVRAYATNSQGTSYATQISFTTLAAQIPSVAPTTAVTNITSTTATSGGNITSGNGSTATARGVCWSTSSNPTIANSKTVDGSGGGTFTSSITGLTANNLYYVRAYATNAIGTGYGSQVSFTSTASITANITSSLVSSGPTYYVVQWMVTLSSPAVGSMVIPCITTNATNTGNTTVSVNFSQGQTSSGANTITYTRPIGTNFTAYSTCGTMPTGYIAGSTASYVILKQ